MPLSRAGLETHGKKLRPLGVDFVDVTGLNVDGFPLAIAALGLDCSIHFVRESPERSDNGNAASQYE